MPSPSPRSFLSCGLLVGLLSGCASGNAGDPAGTPKPLPPSDRTIVTAEDIDRSNTSGDPIERALAAKVPGVLITRTADGGIAIRLRGQTSLMGSNEPLYVIDDVPIQAGPGGALVGINPHDIASIEVLKDAASLSFYGVRGANGVILIKTKHTSN
jgi:TonB-dependent SusC/RagA subfamily outer membrane receptor